MDSPYGLFDVGTHHKLSFFISNMHPSIRVKVTPYGITVPLRIMIFNAEESIIFCNYPTKIYAVQFQITLPQ